MQIRDCGIQETTDLVFRTYQFVHKWHDRYEKYGLKGLEEVSRCGQPPKIPPDAMMQIEEKVYKNQNYYASKTGPRLH